MFLGMRVRSGRAGLWSSIISHSSARGRGVREEGPEGEGSGELAGMGLMEGAGVGTLGRGAGLAAGLLLEWWLEWWLAGV